MVNTLNQTVHGLAKMKPSLELEHLAEQTIDPYEPDWDYDMPTLGDLNGAARKLELSDAVVRTRSFFVTTDKHLGKFVDIAQHICGRNSDSVCGEERHMKFLNEENFLLVRSGRGRLADSFSSKRDDEKIHPKPCEEDVNTFHKNHDSRRSLTIRARDTAKSQKSKNRSAKKAIQIEFTMQEVEEPILPEPSCNDFNALIPFLEEFPNNAPSWHPPVSFILAGGLSRWCKKKTPQVRADDKDVEREIDHSGFAISASKGSDFKHSTKGDPASFDPDLFDASPTSVTRFCSSVSEQTSATAMSDLQYDLKVLARLSTDKSATEYNTQRRVRFAHPLVTALKHRPKTLPEDVPSLFFDPDELLILEQDRVSTLFEEQVECVASGCDNNLAVSVIFPRARKRSMRHDVTTSCLPCDHNDGGYSAVEIESLPKTCAEI